MKTVKAVAPYIHPEYLNFKTAPYEAWVKCGGKTAKPHYPARLFHKLAFQHELPTLRKNRQSALPLCQLRTYPCVLELYKEKQNEIFISCLELGTGLQSAFPTDKCDLWSN